MKTNEGLAVGQVVHYVLTEQDSEQINRRRRDARDLLGRLAAGTWPKGTQAHIGNDAFEGLHCAAVVVQVFDSVPGMVNLKVLLDGNDDFWATSREYSAKSEPLTWHWIERARTSPPSWNGHVNKGSGDP